MVTTPRPIAGISLLTGLLFATTSACAQDGERTAPVEGPRSSDPVSQYWPQWRGPNRDNIADESGWKAAPGAPIWRADVGLGYSTVSIADGRLFTQGHDVDSGEDSIFCFHPVTGEEIWRHSYEAPLMDQFHTGGSLCTPSIDGERLLVASRIGRMFCLDAATGEVRWERDLTEEFDLTVPTWGFAASPLVLDEMIVMNVGKVLAMDRAGKVLWQTKDYGHAYATPATFDFEDKAHLAVFTGFGLVVLDRKSGAELATSKWETRHDVNAATPVVIGDRIFISSGYNTGCSMLRFDGNSLETLWTNREMRNHMSGSILHGEHLYGFDETFLKCLDLDGSVAWSERGLGKGALLVADGKLLALSGRGELVIAEANPEEFVELARQQVFETAARQWTTPVLAGGLLYCRSSQGELVCLDLRASGDDGGDADGGDNGRGSAPGAGAGGV